MTTVTVTPAHLKAVLLFAAKQDVRYYLNGICIETGADGARLIATDGHRMILLRVPQKDEEGSAIGLEVRQFIVPRTAIETALRAFGKQSHIEITYAAPHDAAASSGTIAGLTYTAIDGKFPEYNRIVPATCTGEAAQFNALYIADMAKARAQLGAGSHSDIVYIAHNGNAAALVHLTEDAFAILMPVRADGVEMSPPEWFAPAPAAAQETKTDAA